MERNYIYTDNLKETLSEFSEEQCIRVHKEIDFHIEQYEKMRRERGGPATANNCLRNLQELIIEGLTTKIGRTVTCSTGCSFCCNVEVHITEDEAELLASVLKDRKIEINQEKLNMQAGITDGTWLDRTCDDLTCIFLDENDECKIYQYRPMNCRKLMVTSDPQLCDIKYRNEMVHRFLEIHIKIITTAIMTCTKYGTLPKMLKEKLNDAL